jgi:hypothetical protein
MSQFPATWSSQKQNLKDFVVIKSNDVNYVNNSNNNNNNNLDAIYYITIYGFTTSKFHFLCSTTGSIVTLVESFSMQGFVKSNHYQYYRFFETSNNNNINNGESTVVMFDAKPIGNADVDVYVACKLLTTDDDSGFPSRLKGFYLLSFFIYLFDCFFVYHKFKIDFKNTFFYIIYTI